MEQELEPMERPARQHSSSRRRGRTRFAILVALLLGIVAIIPTLLLKTPLRNRILDSAVGRPELTTTAASARGGWFSPIAFTGVRVTSDDERLTVTIDEVETSQGLLAAIMSGHDKGELVFRQPRVSVVADETGAWPKLNSGTSSTATCRFRLTDGALLLSLPWRDVPIVDVDALNVVGAVARDEMGIRTLTIEPTVIADHAPLSDAHTRQNLALIAPVLSQSTELTGVASVSLEKLTIPLEGPAAGTPVPIRGTATFHSLEARLREDWVRQLTMATGAVAGQSLPSKVTVLEESTVRFAVTGEGVEHDGMTFLLPQVADGLSLQSSGLIRNDESLDLILTISMPEIVPANRPFLTLLSQLSSEPLRLTVTGTTSAPVLGLPEGNSILSELTKRIAPASLEQPAGTIPDAVSGLIQDASQTDPNAARATVPGNVLNLIQSIRDAREKNAATDDSDAARPKKRRRARE